MATRDSGINCFSCGNFSAAEFSSERRGCKVHDFAIPDVDVELVCNDFKTVKPLSSRESQLLQRINNPNALFYHLFPYVVDICEFADFKKLQFPFFSSECISALDIAARNELTGLAVDLTNAFRLWEKLDKRSETLLLLDEQEYPADIFLADYKFKSGAIKKLILYSEGAQNHLQAIFEDGNAHRREAAPLGGLPNLGFVGVSMDFSRISFYRNEILRAL